jgi:hypothetical protein
MNRFHSAIFLGCYAKNTKNQANTFRNKIQHYIDKIIHIDKKYLITQEDFVIKL